MNHTNHSLHYIYLMLLNPLLTPSELNKLGVCPLGINQMSSPLEGFPFFYTKVDISYNGLAWSRCVLREHPRHPHYKSHHIVLSSLASSTVLPLDHKVYEDNHHANLAHHFILRGLEKTKSVTNS